MKITQITTANFPEKDLTALLENYRHEDFYLKTLKPDMDSNEFVKFKIDRIRLGVENGKKIWQVRNADNEVKAVFGLHRNHARSMNFGMEYYELNPVFNFSEQAGEALAVFDNEVLREEAKTLKIDYLKCKVNASDYHNIAAFSNGDYSFFATSLNLYLSRDRYNRGQKKAEDISFIKIAPSHLDEIRELLWQHDHSEDYYDTGITKDKTQKNFYNWLYNFYLTEDARARYNTEILLLYHNKDSRIAGFTCYTKEPAFSKRFNLNLITRDLTVIPQAYHNRGYGSILFAEIMKRENKNVELKLMSNNYKAIGFNHHNGFKCVSSSHFFRKTFNHNPDFGE